MSIKNMRFKLFFFISVILCHIFTMSIFNKCFECVYAKEKPTKSNKNVSEVISVKEKTSMSSADKDSASNVSPSSDDVKLNEANKGTSDTDIKGKQDSIYEYEHPQIEEESYAWLIFKTIFVMAVLVGGFYYFFRFITKKMAITAIGQDVITILSVVPLGQNKFLHVVDIAGRVYVLGVSDSNINLITEIKDKDDIDRIRLLSSKSTPLKQGGFQEYLSIQLGKVLDRMRSAKKTSHRFVQEEINDDVLINFRQRLKKLNGEDV